MVRNGRQDTFGHHNVIYLVENRSFQKIKKGNKWSKIAKELQERSQAKFIRTPK